MQKLRMVWSVADARFQENLAAARVYYQEHWTLCAPWSAVALDKPVGQWLSSLRRPGALAEHPEWKAALKAVDEDWNPPWSTEWQRHYAALRELVRDEEGPAQALPRFTVHGMDVGKWLARQRRPEVWAALADGTARAPGAARHHTARPGPGPGGAGRIRGSPHGARERLSEGRCGPGAVQAGSLVVPRGHVKVLPDGTEVKPGAWLSNNKSRRAKLTVDKLAALADLGLGWAAEVRPTEDSKAVQGKELIPQLMRRFDEL
ncbi:helicase associated domain-containing protein [Streptomyces griseofuscus]|uniref:helicase associated domain-containing protein n=1 Tax=Streptomyces griseofuscus TaxID=146922 RepID=UPI003CC8378A